jgi:hypothetical protein
MKNPWATIAAYEISSFFADGAKVITILGK